MMADQAVIFRPSVFSRYILNALEASEGRRKRRKRDQTPDKIGLDLKRELLERALAEDPLPEAFEAWLLTQTLSAPASGPIRAMCEIIFEEYQFAIHDPDFRSWLEKGAPSADASPDNPDPRAPLPD